MEPQVINQEKNQKPNPKAEIVSLLSENKKELSAEGDKILSTQFHPEIKALVKTLLKNAKQLGDDAPTVKIRYDSAARTLVMSVSNAETEEQLGLDISRFKQEEQIRGKVVTFNLAMITNHFPELSQKKGIIMLDLGSNYSIHRYEGMTPYAKLNLRVDAPEASKQTDWSYDLEVISQTKTNQRDISPMPRLPPARKLSAP